MVEEKKGFSAIWNQFLRFLGEPLQEDNGNYSSMRLMGFLALGASIYFGTLIFSKNTQQQYILQQSMDILKQPQELSEDKKALLGEIINTQNPTLEKQSQNDFSEEFWIVFSFLTFAFGGKFAQKIVEPKEGKDFTIEGQELEIPKAPIEKQIENVSIDEISVNPVNINGQKKDIPNEAMPGLEELRNQDPMRE